MQPFFCPKKSAYPCAWCNSRHTYVVSSNERKPPFFPEYYPDHVNPHMGKKKRWQDDEYRPKPNPFCPNPWDHDYDPFRPHPFKPDEFPFKPKKHDPYNFVIHCHDCNKYSNVKSVFCVVCHKHDTIISKIGPFVNPDDIFNPKYIHEYICDVCKFHPPHPPCNHNWVKHSGEIFSECTAINFVCSKCGEKKTTYSNQDQDPFGGGGYDFYS